MNGADTGADGDAEADAPPPWVSGTAGLELVWAADIDNQTPGWAGKRMFGPFLTPDGDLLVGGSLEGVWSLFGDPPVTTLQNDIVAARLEGATGSARWIRHFANDAFEFGVTAHGQGDSLLFEGSFRDSLDLGGDAPMEADPDPTIENATTHFFAVFDGQGALTRSSTLSHRQGTTFLPVVAWHQEGGTALTSLGYWAQVGFGGDIFDPVVGSMLAARLDPDGSHVWSLQSEPASLNTIMAPQHIGVSASARVLVTALLKGVAKVGGVSIDPGEAEAALLMAFAPDGALSWHAIVASGEHAPVLDTALAGEDALVFGVGDFGEVAGTTGFAARYASDGTELWSRRFGGTGVRSMVGASAPGGATVLAGRFTGSLEVDDETVVSAGGGDAYVAWLDAQGQLEWVARFGGNWDDSVDAIVVDDDGDLYMRSGPIASSGAGSGSIVFSRWRVVSR